MPDKPAQQAGVIGFGHDLYSHVVYTITKDSALNKLISTRLVVFNIGEATLNRVKYLNLHTKQNVTDMMQRQFCSCLDVLVCTVILRKIVSKKWRVLWVFVISLFLDFSIQENLR